MTTPVGPRRPDLDPELRELDVPVGAIDRGGSGSSRGRGAAAIVVGGLVLTVVVGIAGRAADPAVPPDPSQPVALATTGPDAATPVSGRTPATSDRAEALPEIESSRLTRAPIPVFHRRDGDDLQRFSWTPGQTGLVPIGPVPGAYAGIQAGAPAVVTAAPAGDVFAVRGLGSFGGVPGDTVRILTGTGRELWSREDAKGLPIAPLWSPDGRRIVMPGSDETWRILTVDPDGSVLELPVTATLDPAATPSPRPTGAASPTRLEPVAFSVDGRWLYAVTSRLDEAMWRPAARISTEDGRLEPVQSFPAAGPESFDPGATARFGFEVDPATGRFANAGRSLLATGPTEVSVFEPDGELAFASELDTVFGLAWAGDGRLLVLDADQVPEPTRLRLVPIAPDGEIGSPLLETGPISGAGIVGVRDGHVLLGMATSGEDAEVMLAMVRLSDERWASHRFDPAAFESLEVGGWLP